MVEKIRGYVSALVIAMVATSLAGRADASDAAVLPQSAAIAEITFPAPRSASLLQLRGFVGSGTALFRIDGVCSRMDVRLVAGDFLGDSLGVSGGGPVHIRVVDVAAVRKLYMGGDLVSEHKEDGIEIVSGLPAGTGFVINAGSSIIEDIFGVSAVDFQCE